MKRMSILGSTGSIGINALEVIKSMPHEFKAVGLSAHHNGMLLSQQIEIFKPLKAALNNKELYPTLKERFSHDNIEILTGRDGLVALATMEEADMVVSAVVGAAGIIPTVAAIRAGKDIALANKEVLVIGGELVMKAAEEHQVKILPVDSEHSALFQCMEGRDKKEIKRLIITASGGPFLTKNRNELADVTPEQALKHPNWTMGKKISIDSATMMNKGMELIEARWLFDVNPSMIDIVIHPESIVHSIVEFIDGTMLAHLSLPDMKIPIQYALCYPERRSTSIETLDLAGVGKLQFIEPDLDKFPALRLAFNAAQEGRSLPVVLNAANEVAVEYFLNGDIKFVDIPSIIERVMDDHTIVATSTIDEIMEIDSWAREQAEGIIARQYA